MTIFHRTRAHGICLATILSVLLLVVLPAALVAQNPLLPLLGGEAPTEPAAGEAGESGDATAAESPPAAPPLAPHELVPRAARLGDEAERALRQVAAVAATDEERESLFARLGASQDELSERLDRLLADRYVPRELLAEIDEAAEVERRQLDALMEQASARLQELETLRAEWRERRAQWVAVRESLADDPDLAGVYQQAIESGLEEIDRVLEATGEALPELVGRQQSLQELVRSNRRLEVRTEEALERWRANLLDATEPWLFGERYLAGLREVEPVTAVTRGVATLGADARRSAESLLFASAAGLLLGLGIGFFGRRMGRGVAPESRWSGLLARPWSIGALVAAVGVLLLPGLPLLGRTVVAVVLATAVVRIARGMFRNPLKRRLAYGVAGLYVLLALLQAVALPVPLFRPLLAVLMVVAVLALLLLARANRTTGRQAGFTLVLQGAAAFLAVVLAAEVAGYHPLALWLLDGAVTTAFVAFITVFLVRLGSGAVLGLFGSPGRPRLALLARLSGDLPGRLMFLLQVVLAGCALLYVLSIWELADGPAEAWARVVGAGFSIGSFEITVGRLLLAAVAVYLAFLASSVVRALLAEQVFERRDLDRGVRDSISTLLHYTLVVLGVFVALSTIGFDLSAVALLAGALGVGIGFGLQGVVGNFFSGLVLLFERPIRVGDVVIIQDQWGTVKKIGLRSTVVQTFDQSEIIVPNTDLISEKVVNWTLSSRSARLVLPVGVAYGSDMEKVLAVLQEIGAAHPDALEDPPPMAIFVGFGESSLDFELRIWLADIERRLTARTELATAIVRRFAALGIQIPFPQRDLHLRSVDREVAGRLERPEPTDDRESVG